MNDTIRRLIALLPEVKVPQAGFMSALLSVFCIAPGKANFRNLSRFCNYHEKTFSRWFRRSFPFLQLNKALLIEEGISQKHLLGSIDASFLKKSGKSTEGLGMFWNGSAGRSERGLEVSLVAVTDLQANTAYALDAILTPPSENKGTRVSRYCEQLERVAPALKELGVTHIAADGYYSKKSVVDCLASLDFSHVGKLRKDANLWWPYEGEYGGRGRPRKYKEKVDLKGELSGWESVSTLEDGTSIYQAKLRHKGWGGELINVVLLRKVSRCSVYQALLFSTDLNLSGEQMVTYYKARFQIEFVFRDAKQHTGLGDCQSPKRDCLRTHVNASFTALNMMKLEDRRLAATEEERVISIESWRRKKLNQHLMDRLFSRLKIDVTDKKVKAIYEEFSDFGRIAA